MRKFLIERSVPGAGTMSADELQGISAKSVSVLRDLGPDVQWVHSYVLDDKLYCVYHATDPELIREHARVGGFPCDSIMDVSTMISPHTAKA
ncbi:MAG: DUF4242 domain-containing protein [Pseudonocardiaceae bacterium]|nr:DUF4242 domain-containing protein [Pseudonocardiaceae bacterium]